ncbi:hypothetical protein VRRI112168_00555 [Vreelandella rituensis]|uniref:Type IV pilus biogenesis protein PilP n=1 Tax=Vreelandella rituensis TaxID=2282306 RepID=A0A368UAX8_9GAMM|nr:hypothetical protein [Halomonas rituensis]RCV93816.1 hypothetical protein DU506_01270 [Halomonas rituensis]
MKRTLITGVIASILTPAAFAQVSQAEFQAMLESNPSVAADEQEDSTEIQVVTIDAPEIFREIDANRIELQELNSQIDIYTAKKNLLTVINEIEEIQSGVAAKNEAKRSGAIDSTMPFEKAEQESQLQKLEAYLASLEASLQQGMSELSEKIDSPPPASSEQVEATKAAKEPVTNHPHAWSLVETKIAKNGAAEAEIVNIFGIDYRVKAGEKAGPWTIQSIKHGEVIVKLNGEGDTKKITPRRLHPINTGDVSSNAGDVSSDASSSLANESQLSSRHDTSPRTYSSSVDSALSF